MSSPVSVSIQELVGLRSATGKVARRQGKRVVAPTAGAAPSAALGRGLDFSEVREYHGGDDVRMIDWKVTARTGRAHTKLFNEERERPFLLALDLRPPMYFGTRVAFKSVFAARLCALVAWAALSQRDRVGGLVFSSEDLVEIKPIAGSKGVTRLLHQIVKIHNRAKPSDTRSGSTPPRPLSDALVRLNRCAQTGSSICLVSDFTHFDAGARTANLLQRNHTVAVHLHDPLEARLPPPGRYAISDGRFHSQFSSASSRVREQYSEEFAYRVSQLQSIFSGPGNGLISTQVTDNAIDVAAQVVRSLPGSS